MDEKVIATKQCKNCGSSFDITDKEEFLRHKISPHIGNAVYELPQPTLCPDCRQQRRLARRNERKLYHRACSMTGKKIISLYSMDKDIPIYHHQDWRSDKRDEMDYGQDWDSGTTFFQQFLRLLHRVPRISTYNKRTENTEYGNNVIADKDCYMLFITFDNDHCYYSYTIGYCKDCIDCLRGISCQKCYECTKVQNCYECFYCFNCQNCFNSQYLKDCFNMDNSSFCIGLRNKKHYVLNKAYTKSEYQEFIVRLRQDKDFEVEMKQEFTKLKLSVPVNASTIEQSEDSIGDYLDNCKNCVHCFDTLLAQDCRYCYDCGNAVDNLDVYIGGAAFANPPGSLAYETDNSFNSTGVCFCSSVAFRSSNILYSDTCHACKDCFGCVGIRYKEYCILNKQYTKEEYETLVPRIIQKMKADGERGEFFPTSMSPFGYNETEAQTYYPITKEQALAKGRKWHDDTETKIPEGVQAIQAKDLPSIQDVTDDILNKVIICEVTQKPFKLIKQELEFYRKYNIPLPTKCFDQRHLERMRLKNPRKVLERNCMKCGMSIQITYAPERKEIVYCQKCYYKEVYG